MMKNVYYVVKTVNGGVKFRDGWYATRKDAENVMKNKAMKGGIYTIETYLMIS